MYESLHGLVYAAYGHVDGVLDDAVISLDTYKIAFEVVVDGDIIES